MTNIFALGLSPSGNSQATNALNENQIMIGWACHGDLRSKTREEIKESIKDHDLYTNKPNRVSGDAGKIYRFLNDIEVGDYVISPSASLDHWYAATVLSDAKYYEEYSEIDSPNRRDVIWLGDGNPIRLNENTELLTGLKSALRGTIIGINTDTYRHILNDLKNASTINSDLDNISNYIKLSDAEIIARMTALMESQKEQKILGERGEEFVLLEEIEKLKNINRHDLASRVEHTSRRLGGDRFGYDIKSFDEHGSEIFIEVKTTIGFKETPFHLTDNQMNSAKNLGDYFIYRVYNFGTSKQDIFRFPFRGFEVPKYETESMTINHHQFKICLK